jgi:hypothetical protein
MTASGGLGSVLEPSELLPRCYMAQLCGLRPQDDGTPVILRHALAQLVSPCEIPYRFRVTQTCRLAKKTNRFTHQNTLG